MDRNISLTKEQMLPMQHMFHPIVGYGKIIFNILISQNTFFPNGSFSWRSADVPEESKEALEMSALSDDKPQQQQIGMCMCVCVCVCVRERGRSAVRRVCVCVCVCVWSCETSTVISTTRLLISQYHDVS